LSSVWTRGDFGVLSLVSDVQEGGLSGFNIHCTAMIVKFCPHHPYHLGRFLARVRAECFASYCTKKAPFIDVELMLY